MYRTLTLIALLLALPRPVSACTTFLMSGGAGPVVGKSYDWDTVEGHVIFNKRGVQKRALVLDPRDRPAEWVSRHASLTFNQYGREMPNGGINDAGLVVEVMWLAESVFPPRDPRPAVNELQWIQYQLDNFATVAEVRQHAAELRPLSNYAKVHYLVCDRAGNCAAVELLGGELVLSAGGQLPVPVLTNSTYTDSVRQLRKHSGFGGGLAIPKGQGSLERFVRAAHLARQGGAGDPVRRAFTVLEGVRCAGSTQWQVVYDLKGLRVFWRTRAQPTMKSAALAQTVGGCETPVAFADMSARPNNEDRGRAHFRPWTVVDNEQLLRRSMAKLRAKLPPGTVERLARYPSELRCAAGRPGSP